MKNADKLKPFADLARLFPDGNEADAMKKNLTDQDIERLVQSVMCDAMPNDEELRSIADSPAMWWAVQREIANAETRSPWPPANVVRRWLMLLAPVAVMSALVISLFVWWPMTAIQETAKMEPATRPATPGTAPVDQTTPLPLPEARPIVASTQRTTHSPTVRRPNAVQPTEVRTLIAKAKPKTSETKSEFISLSYAADPTSGQVVRVKVPRSMMVTLGLVASVEKPANLVDAEVVVGDDGLTRAIRFIH
jgi:hypothetical protein